MLEKLLFGGLLIAFMQVPILSDHYVQYLTGYAAANQAQIDQLEVLAASNNFRSAEALIESLQNNPDSIVRQDAGNKWLLLSQHKQVQADIQQLTTGNYLEQLLFLIQPRQYPNLNKVINNFKPGIPLTLNDLLASIGSALLLSFLLCLPFRRKRKTHTFYRGDTAS